MGRVAGKVAFITGAGRGQGRAHAVRLAEEGADIIATDICGPVSDRVLYPMATPDDLAETKELVEKLGRRCATAVADVRRIGELKAAVAAGLEAFGHIDVVCANAGVITFHPSALEIPEDAYDAVVDTNLKGVWNTIQATAPAMIEAGHGGSMILTSSAAGIRGQVPYAHYVASKHGVVGLMKAFANELGQHRIRVNTVHPTGVATPMGSDGSALEMAAAVPLFVSGAANILPDLDSPTDAAAPLGVGVIQPRDVSQAVLWLASDESRYVTGLQLTVDAGNTNKP
ncbi:mycofactocin-coupled SDR family oxidoreductase [Streptomyces sp. NPDC002577]